MFKTISLVFGSTAIFLGLMVAAGSDGMCGGHVCGPDIPPNTIGEMLMIAFIGLCLFGTGAWIAISSEK